jgi:hypothetical protein
MSIDQIRTTARPLPNGDPATWVYLADLELPAEQQREVDEICRRVYWWWQRRKWRRDVEEEVKLRHFFPGKTVAIKHTPRGLLVLMAGDYGSPEYVRFLEGLSRAERCQILLDPIRDPHDETAYLGMYLDDLLGYTDVNK